VPAGEKLSYLRGYRWSSLPGYLTTAKRSAVVEYRLVLAGFGGDHEQGRHAYARFIEEGVKDGVSSPWEQLTGQVLLGSESFVERMRQRVRSTRGTVREQPARRVLFKAWEVDALLRVVARVLRREVRELCSRGGGLERAMVMECLYRYTPASQVEIGRQMGGVDYSWVSRMRRELRQALQRDAAMKKRFQELLSFVKRMEQRDSL
jgi:hypothetical protein